jgi:threonine dehydrogenase-like Zn-dependent dehydrogenase
MRLTDFICYLQIIHAETGLCFIIAQFKEKGKAGSNIVSSMKAVVFKEIGRYSFEDRPVPEIKKDDEVRFKILAASICGTDVHILSDPPGVPANPGIILGHECVGEVTDIGKNVQGLNPGDHVILDNNITCGVCPACRNGESNMCINMKSMGVHCDGVFSEFAVAPEKSVVKIPQEVSVKKAIFAEPLNCVMGAIKKLKILPGMTCLVLGGGSIGLYFTALLKLCGAAKVLVSEVSEYRSRWALMNGANRVINPVKENLEKEVKDETDGIGADIVVDAVGSLLTDSVQCVRSAGQILLFGLNKNAMSNIHQYYITQKGITVYGNFIGLNTKNEILNSTINTRGRR